MANTGTPPMIDERQFAPATIEQARALYEALLAMGIPLRQARGIAAWVMFHPERRSEDPTSDKVRADYRRVLLRLGKPPWEANRDTVGEISSTAFEHYQGRSEAA